MWGPTDRQKASAEMLTAWAKASEAVRRARILAHPERGIFVDVTEAVVSIMDRLTSTLDWGSGFFDDDDLAAFFVLADFLKIEVPPSVERPPALDSGE